MKKAAEETTARNGSSTESIVQKSIFVKPFVIGLNNRVINKDPNHANLNACFETRQVTLNELEKHIHRGHAIAGDFKGWRSRPNYRGTQVLFLDFDTGFSIQKALADSFISQYAALIYTSVRHGKDGEDRFRILFVTPEYLPKEKAVRIQKQLGLKFPQADTACHSVLQPYYGNTNAVFPLIQNVCLPENIIDELDREALVNEFLDAAQAKDRKADLEALERFTGAEGANRIERALLECLNVIPPRGESGEGRYVEIRNVGYALRSFFGSDKAYELLNRWSPEDDSDMDWHGIVFGAERPEGDIDYEYVFNLARKYGWKQPKDLYQYDFESDIPEANETVCQKYLGKIPSVPQKIIGIVSPTGTGKSLAIQRCIETLDEKEKVVFVFHRRTLARTAADKSKGLIRCYEDIEDLSKFGGNVAITVDSLHKLNMPTFKGCTVVFDETSSVIRQLQGKTIKQPKETVDAFYFILGGAKKVICLESGLAKAALDVIKSFSGAEDAYVLRNTYRVEKGKAKFYNKALDVLNVAEGKLTQNKRVAIAIDGGEATVTKYSEVLRAKQPDKKIFGVHSGNSGSFSRYLENPESLRAEGVDVLIYSPTLFEGADLSFIGEAHFDVVCLLREYAHISPEGVAQALDRVRDIGDREVHIYCSEASDAGSVSPAVIYNDWQRDMKKSLAYMQPDIKAGKHEFSNFYAVQFKSLAAFEARDNMIRRCIRANVEALLRRKGYEIIEADVTPTEVISQNDVKEVGKEIEASKVASILASEDITEAEAERRKGQNDLTERENNEVEKYHLRQLNGGSDVDLEYVVSNRKTIRNTVHAFEQTDMTFEQLQTLQNSLNKKNVDGGYVPIVDKVLLRQKAFEVIGGWNYIGTLDAGRFVTWYKTLPLESRLDIGLRFTDKELQKPQKVLGMFLQSMGLKTRAVRSRQGESSRRYTFDPHQQEQLQNILARRRDHKEQHRIEVATYRESENQGISWDR